MERKKVPADNIKKRTKSANLAFPDAMVHNYESLIDLLQLPDPKDCHVLAAAIKVNADLIVTNNTKHFPAEYLSTFGISAKTADDFLTDIIDLNTSDASEAFKQMVLNRTNPALNEFEMLDILRNRGLKHTADFLHSQIWN